jgi:hypothetical protein
MDPLGTVWVAPGTGATGQELLDAFSRSPFVGRVAPPIFLLPGKKTNLALTGKRLQYDDLERLEKAQ